MQRDNNIINSVEIVNVPPAEDNEVFDKADVPSGATELDQKDLQRLFQGRNLAFISSLSKESPNSWQQEEFFTTKPSLIYPNAIKTLNIINGIDFQQLLTFNSTFILVIRFSIIRDP